MAPDDRRDAIVTATLPLLVQSGGGVTTKEIAAAAGIAEGTVFRVFETKDELIRACFGKATDTSEVRRRLRAVDRGLPLDERLVVAVEIMHDHVGTVISLMTALHSSGVHLPRPRAASSGPRRRPGDPEVDAELVDLIGPDATRLRVPVERAVTYLSMLTMASVHPFLPDTETTAAEVVGVLLTGVLSPDPTDDHHTESETR